MPHEQEVQRKTSLCDLWKYTGYTIRFKNKTAAEHKVVQEWRTTCQVPLEEALQAFETAMWKLHPGEGKVWWALLNNLKLDHWPEGKFQDITADSKDTNLRLWDAWSTYCALSDPFSKIHMFYQKVPSDQRHIWLMKRQCCREMCWQAKIYLVHYVNGIAPSTLKWTAKKDDRNYHVDWTSKWNPAGDTPRASVPPSLVSDDDDTASVTTWGEDWE